ncbi:uncharacterized protein Z519_04647 [Cladophialophora bantiana CBS 173.52]|uniref:2-oxoadipate dioxygenase/decarboxylase n=1 Tax=Cladophialophora bantiana (strain ATCC 10958 / CBS 173.52 / CDC B-1940 / NIH 8579) TaxID=1442370 RepID=A0A0D2HUX2_CLAB1|nr:uncharacterized protein Z519_04647 [Cladophialophora bantiana CBS 173.52]KIW94670.1 hypothetical protein Z519_04647 [Cladophialophora bantiana CBS 173.52]
MSVHQLVRDADQLRTRFSQAMSDMYKKEVPLYADLLSIVGEVDDKVSREKLPSRHGIERHGAIRLGTAQELRTIARLFALFNMHPVGYYDLSVVGFPLHATAFRPLTSSALANNPFRVFTSLLRLDLLPQSTQILVEKTLSRRNIFSDRLLELLKKAEFHGLLVDDEDELLMEAMKVFRWHSTATVSHETYTEMNAVHPMIADIVSFPSAHINHLTPRTLDIDMVQEIMIRRDMPAKERIEGPPRRNCGVLLRQTSFKALEEQVWFIDSGGYARHGYHTARFGEVEQRGAAVTDKGRRLYDSLLAKTNAIAKQKKADEEEYQHILRDIFAEYPDTWPELHKQGLVFFVYRLTGKRPSTTEAKDMQKLSDLLEEGIVEYEPIVYEDFLPISAAGIFTSNLRGFSNKEIQNSQGNRHLLEESLGAKIQEPTSLYEKMQAESLEECRKELGLALILVE